MNILWIVKDIISPKKCYFCGTEWYFFCLKCYWKAHKIPELCYVCKKESSKFAIHLECRQFLDARSLMVLFSYSRVQKIIKDSKYYAKKDVLEDIGKYMWEFLLKNLQPENKEEYIILPVPMNIWRKWKRWYNHADVLAKHISVSSWIAYNAKILKRVKNTLQQSKLTRSQRFSNLEGAFQVNQKHKDLLKDKKIIIVDDVVSTWVTFLEVWVVLRDQDIQSIDCIAIASDTQFFDEKR